MISDALMLSVPLRLPNKNRFSPVVHAEFQPAAILESLDRHGVEYVLIGGYAALLHGSTLPTRDLDITPRRQADNLTKLIAALEDLDARVRVSDDVEPLPFKTSPESLSTVTVLNLATRFGDLDLVVQPAGFPAGYDSLAAGAEVETIGGVGVKVAALSDVIASKEAAGRDKDIVALPLLIGLLNRQRDR
ncbi:MAG: hypothetical protein KDB72_04940 [Mycobacterium sp.]|nr:hypothetical protein [Mycobacterium sp.]